MEKLLILERRDKNWNLLNAEINNLAEAVKVMTNVQSRYHR